MKLRLRRPKVKGRGDPERGWPGYLFGGRIRTTTVALILAFLVVWWAYDTYRPTPKPAEVPQVVPPGYVPDPNYTWVPRSRLQQPPVTVTETETPAPVTETVTPPPSEPIPPPFPLPPPFGPPPPAPEPPPWEPAPPPGASAPPPGAPLPAPAPAPAPGPRGALPGPPATQPPR